MSAAIKTWLVIGSLENWDTAFAQPIPLWGLRESYSNSFQLLSKGDLIVVYVVSPIKGVVGFANVKDKYIDRGSLIWPDEKRQKKVIWPLRFRLSDINVIPRSYWQGGTGTGFPKPIDIADFQIFWQKGFHALSDEQSVKIFSRVQQNWGQNYSALTVQETIPQHITEPIKIPGEAPLSPHRKIQQSIVEIGRLQFYYPEMEFQLPIEDEHKRLDVVWKRELAGVPTFVFEVELSGGIEKAITKLRLAFTKWNSQPRLVVPETFHKSVDGLIAHEQIQFRSNLRYYDPAIIDNLLAKKQDLRSFEEKYGIY